MSASHFVYGLSIKANRAIPCLTPSTTEQQVDIQVQLGRMPPWLEADKAGSLEEFYVSLDHDSPGVPILMIWKLPKGYFWLRYADGSEFVIDQAGTEIWATWPESFTVEDSATYLLGPVMGFVLLLRGTICLHASAIAVGNRAFALVGQAGAGKSTTAAAFARLGYKILSDDVCTLSYAEGTFVVQPAYPCIRLWPRSVEVLYGRADALPLLTPNWDKRYLDLSSAGHESFQSKPLPLAAVYVLSERSDSPDSPYVEIISGKEGLLELIGNTYANYLMETSTMRAQEFRVLTRLMHDVPMRRAVAHSDPSRLVSFCQTIVDDFQSMAFQSV
jgi:hypothetical protein